MTTLTRLPNLNIELDRPLPEMVSVGAGTAIFVGGRCFHPRSRIRSLSLVVDGERQAVIAHSMPLLDHFRELHAGVSPYDTSAMSEDPSSSEDPSDARIPQRLLGRRAHPPRR